MYARLWVDLLSSAACERTAVRTASGDRAKDALASPPSPGSTASLRRASTSATIESLHFSECYLA